MAFVTKNGGRYCVRKGNTGEVLTCFSGKDAKKNADMELTRLHRKNNPSRTNRGSSAAKRYRKNK